MIKLLRIDDRLLHGQVAMAWTKNLGIHTIVIANDSVASDEFLKMTLGLAKPIDVELRIENVENATKFIKANIESRQNVMVIINNLVDAKRILSVTPIKSLNIGNLRERKDSVRYSFSMTLTPEDISICKELIDAGIELELRMVPEEKKVLIKNLINK